MRPYRILTINPGSTSTKIAVYDGEQCSMMRTVGHPAEVIASFPHVTDQLDMRIETILSVLTEENVPLKFDAVIGRGGLARAFESGVYAVNDDMMEAMRNAEHQHACDLGCILAHEMASRVAGGCPSYIADPGAVDEMDPIARVTGSPLMPRICIWHALNQRAIARRYAAEHNTSYEKLNLIIAHLGGGISVAAHHHGRAVDVNNALDGEGPFSPERAGTLPAADLIKLCYSGRYTERQLRRRIAGKAGLAAHLGTTDMRIIEERIEQGDDNARLVVDAMAYQIAKSIAAQAAVLKGKVNAILLTGGMAHSDYVVERIADRVSWIAPVKVYPGENEMRALAQNALAALEGRVAVREF